MSALRWMILFLVTGIVATGCGRWSKRGRANNVVYIDEGVIASATAEWYPQGERTVFARRSTGILIVTAEQLRFMTYDDPSEAYTSALSLNRSDLSCGQRSGSVSKGELWCRAGEQSYLFVSKEAGKISEAFLTP